MKHKVRRTVSIVLAVLLVVIQLGVITTSAASSAKGGTVILNFPMNGRAGLTQIQAKQFFLPHMLHAEQTDSMFRGSASI